MVRISHGFQMDFRISLQIVKMTIAVKEKRKINRLWTANL